MRHWIKYSSPITDPFRGKEVWDPWTVMQPDIPQRLDSELCALGQEVFMSERWYWEVKAGDRSGLVLAVAKDNVEGVIAVSPEKWVLWTRVLGYALFSCLLYLGMAQEGSDSPSTCLWTLLLL